MAQQISSNHRAQEWMPPVSVMKRKSQGDSHSPYPSILKTFFWLGSERRTIWWTTFGLAGLQSTCMLLAATRTILLEKVCSSNAFSVMLQLIDVRMDRAERLQRYMGAKTKQVAMGVQTASLGSLEGSSWYLSQMAAGMKRSPAMMTSHPCSRAVLVLSRVKVDARHNGIWVSFCSRMILRILLISCCESCFCLKLERSQDSGINNKHFIQPTLSHIRKNTECPL